ncbi:MAG: hypothetical protein J7K75_09590, partial [Desulfuromonas sp.]|nr:hypothetical protein [Desulfuromonas sp.]
NFFGINLDDLTGHQFTKSYMASGHQAETKILNDTVSKIDNLNFPDTDLGTGVITATLTWGSNPDLDLHIFEPNGTQVYYSNMTGPSGYLDVDDVTSYGPEHYFVSCDILETGTYRFGVNYYAGSSLEMAALTIKAGDQIRSCKQAFTDPLGSSGNVNPLIMFEVQVTGSREEGFEFAIR